MNLSLLALHAADDAVAFGSPSPRTAAELLHDAARVCAALPAPRPGSHVLVAVRADCYHFAAALLGSWAAGHAVAIPPVDVAREAFLQLAQRPEMSAVLHDTFSGAPLRIDRLLAEASDVSAPALALGALAANDLGVAFYDDASEPLHVRRSQLLIETAAQATAAALPERARSAASVSPEARHGLTLGLLWPLASGGAFGRQLAASELTPGAPILITAPAHLRALLRAHRPLMAAELFVVSGGGPLPDAARARLAEEPRVHVHDVGDPRDRRALLEEEIAWSAGVSDAALLELEGAGERPPRRLLAIAADGGDAPRLRERLAARFERVLLLPSAALRRGGAGQQLRARVLRLFDLSAEGAPLAFELALRGEQLEPTRASYHFHVPTHYVYFEGHFPGHPILPGAAQLSEMVLPCVRRARPELGRLTRMSRIKFQERIKPDDLVEVALSFPGDPLQVDFALRRGGNVCAAGRLWFEPRGAREPQP